MTMIATYVDLPVTNMPPERPRVPPRTNADSELRALLEEIPTWPDAMLIHMHERFGTSRLFRVRHDPAGELTERAKQLRDAAYHEMTVRGLASQEQEES